MSPPIKLLHVDDDPHFSEMSAEYLRRADEELDIVTGTGAEEGLSILGDESIDCIVSDYDMPKIDGIEFLEIVRDQFGDIPFILFTGKGSEEVAGEAIAAGATEYLQKSPGADQYELLVNRITNAVEQFRSERERRRNERRFETVFQDPNMLVQLLDREGRVIQANRRSLAYVAEDEANLVGEPFWETPWWTQDQRAEVEEWIDRAISGEYVEFEAECEAGGKQYHLIGTVRPVRESGDTVTSLIVSSQEITGQIRREIEFREQTRALEAVLDTVEAGIVMKDAESRYVLINKTWREQLGIPPDAEIEGLTDYELFSARIASRFRAEDRRVFQEREPIEIEHRVPTMSGSRVHLTRKSPVVDATGTFEGICAVSTDITERKEREHALERADQYLDIVLSNAPVVLFGLDPDGTIAFVRGNGLEPLDIERDALVGESIIDLFEGNEAVREDLQEALDGERSSGNYLVERSILRTTLRPVETESGEHRVIGFSIDVSDRSRLVAERRVVAELIDDTVGFFHLDEDLVYQHVDPTIEKLLGASDGELVGGSIDAVLDEAGVEAMSALRERADSAEDRVARDEIAYRTRDGEDVPCEVYLTVIDVDGTVDGSIGVLRRVERHEDTGVG